MKVDWKDITARIATSYAIVTAKKATARKTAKKATAKKAMDRKK